MTVRERGRPRHDGAAGCQGGAGASATRIAAAASTSSACVAIVLIGFPVYWMVATALKPGDKSLTPTPHWFPYPITIDNFSAAVHKDFFVSSLRNSALVVVSVVVLSLLVASLAALAVARFNFRGRALFIIAIIGVQMVPLAGW